MTEGKTSDPPTTVVSVRGRRAELIADPQFVYVGRRVGRGRHFVWYASEWGNPLKPGMTVSRVQGQFDLWRERQWIDRNIVVVEGDTLVDLHRKLIMACPVLRGRLHELRGKRLGCWCGEWAPGMPALACHAVTLAELADGPMGDPR